jgi:hypothetical protein
MPYIRTIKWLQKFLKSQLLPEASDVLLKFSVHLVTNISKFIAGIATSDLPMSSDDK